MDTTQLPTTREEANEIKTTYFYTGRWCCNDHKTVRLTSSGACQDCANNSSKKHKRNNKAKIEENRNTSFV